MSVDEVVDQLAEQHINDFNDLRIEHLARVLDIKIGFNDDANCYVRYQGNNIILLRKSTPYEMWLAFCHELGHMMLHSTKQYCMSRMFNEYQESQADKFALLMMMPGKLIEHHELYDAKDVAYHFKVPFEIALKRLEMLVAKLKIY